MELTLSQQPPSASLIEKKRNLGGVKYTYVHGKRMAHKTITISEQAYRSLARLKSDKESFTEAILRLTSEKGSASSLLDLLENLPRSEDLAKNVEVAMTRLRTVKLRRISLG
jgi:predicted CopG family antitoxin